VQVSFTIEDNMDLYLDISGGNVKQIKVFLDDEQIADDRYQSQAFHVGCLTKGQTVMLECTFNDNGTDSGVITIHSAQFQQEVWNKVYEELQRQTLQVSEYRDGYFKGTVTTDRDSLLFLSIPYDEGWSVLLDGKEVETGAVLNAFMAVELPEGSHTLELSYASEGFYLGLLISLISLLLFVIFWMLTAGYRRRQPAEQLQTGEEKESEGERTDIVIDTEGSESDETKY
ncbi:MAG: YfhO family protein, partial [Lachnospiraceae bacterium]|nr:YfhO family protein [Lachnospiraceae bacterium]